MSVGLSTRLVSRHEGENEQLRKNFDNAEVQRTCVGWEMYNGGSLKVRGARYDCEAENEAMQWVVRMVNSVCRSLF